MVWITVNRWVLQNDGVTKKEGTMDIQVNKKVASTVGRIFERIFTDTNEKFPIIYKYSDGTVATHGFRNDIWTDEFAEHSHGIAIDINPGQNGFYENGVLKEGFGQWRPNIDPYSILMGGSVVRAFEEYGWLWGEKWGDTKDYMHFSWIEDSKKFSPDSKNNQLKKQMQHYENPNAR